jgi:hypothetical protein
MNPIVEGFIRGDRIHEAATELKKFDLDNEVLATVEFDRLRLISAFEITSAARDYVVNVQNCLGGGRHVNVFGITVRTIEDAGGPSYQDKRRTQPEREEAGG